MKKRIVALRNGFIGFMYRNVLKRVFFLMDPEVVHDRTVRMGKILGSNFITRDLVSLKLGYSNSKLRQNVLGIDFRNPIGLAAGFDKNAELFKVLPSVGFGFEEVGSITGERCEGNPKPRLWRLKKSKGLVVHYGLKNEGCKVLSEKLRGKKFKFPVGISIAKTNCKETVDTTKGISDYFKAYKAFRDIGDYYTINISCPNAYGGEPFTDAKKLDKLFKKLDSIPRNKPVFLKISPDLSRKEIDSIIKVGRKYKIDGFVCTNLTKKRDNNKIIDANVPEKGGISGPIMKDLSNDMIGYIYSKTKGEFVIIGCGGVSSAQDAYVKIRLGASLVQLITGMIFEGPQLISDINLGLVKLLERDGFENISEAIGVDANST